MSGGARAPARRRPRVRTKRRLQAKGGPRATGETTTRDHACVVAFPEEEALPSKLLANEATVRGQQQEEAEEVRAHRLDARAGQLARANAVSRALMDYQRVLEMLSRLDVMVGASDKSECDAWMGGSPSGIAGIGTVPCKASPRNAFALSCHPS